MKIILLTLVFLISISCNHLNTIPENYTETKDKIAISPDYTDIVIPPNIAPLNFTITSAHEKAIIEITGKNGEQMVASCTKDNPVRINMTKWKSLLENNKGEGITYTVYTCNDGKWFKHPSFTNHIAKEDIDQYISYRLIEPGFSSFYDLGIYQRDLYSFNQSPIYENKGDHCINCHTYQNYKTNRMLFHVRETNSGTIFTDGDEVVKINTKSDSMMSACVYPSWHPTKNIVAFSNNKTGQFFHTKDLQKTEVVDMESDLVIFDVSKREVIPLITTELSMETYPSWSPKGDRLYYSVCNNVPQNYEYLHGSKDMAISEAYSDLKYDIWYMPFDTVTSTFGEPKPEVLASESGKSATFAKISPDNKWLLYSAGDFGQFHIWHKSSDLYVKNLLTGDIKPLEKANSDDVESYHSWSSNGKWIVFSSRREDKNYTRLYICYFDEDGNEYKPFVVPQESPDHDIMLLKSYNMPEFMIEPVRIANNRFRDVIMNTEAEKVSFRSSYDPKFSK